jgi:hypothetical protein
VTAPPTTAVIPDAATVNHTVVVPPTPGGLTPAAADRKAPSLHIDIPSNIVGPKLDLLKRNLGNGPPQSGGAPSIRALKRLSREEIQNSSTDALAIYVLRDNERALVFDFPNIREQGRMFARLILFVERAGASKTRVMTVPDVQKWLAQNSEQVETLTVGNNMRTGNWRDSSIPRGSRASRHRRRTTPVRLAGEFAVAARRKQVWR